MKSTKKISIISINRRSNYFNWLKCNKILVCHKLWSFQKWGIKLTSWCQIFVLAYQFCRHTCLHPHYLHHPLLQPFCLLLTLVQAALPSGVVWPKDTQKNGFPFGWPNIRVCTTQPTPRWQLLYFENNNRAQQVNVIWWAAHYG